MLVLANGANSFLNDVAAVFIAGLKRVYKEPILLDLLYIMLHVWICSSSVASLPLS